MSSDALPRRRGSFRDLDVWKRACDLVIHVYDLTATFPSEEKFESVKHMRKTVWSIPLNVAEGSARYRRLEFLHFLNIAAGSLAELETFLSVAQRLGLGDDSIYRVCADTADEVGRMLYGLTAAIRNRK